MNNSNAIERVINLFIRTTTLLCRFVFIFFLAKFLSPSEVGLYGLVTAAIAYSTYFVGLDFYTYTTRELASYSKTEWGDLLKNQMALSIGLYCLVLPSLVLLFTSDILPLELAKWFFMLVILEHITQELTRFFVAASQQLVASFVLLFRQGSWAVVVIMLMFFREDYRNLDIVFNAWVIACAFALVFSVFMLNKMHLGGWKKDVNYQWIWKGVKIAVPFLVATLAIRGVFTIDRYWINFLAGLEVVGAYVLFVGVASTLMTFLDAAVFSFSYPKMIEHYKKNQPHKFRNKMREMLFFTTGFAIFFTAVSFVVLPYLLHWLDKEVYLQNYTLFYWLLLATILNALGMIPHYAVYAQKRDRSIIQSHLVALPVFIIVTAIISVWSPVYAVPIGLCASQLFILLWKLKAYQKTTPVEFLGISTK